VALSGTYDKHGDSTAVHMKLDAPNIPLQDVQALLPAVGVTLPAGSSLQGGAVNTHLLIDGPVDSLVTTGDVNLSNAKLAGFGLGAKLAALSAFTGTKPSQDTVIQLLSSNLRIAPDGIRTENLKLEVADLGTITGGGTIAVNNALNYKMVFTASGSGTAANLATRVGFGNSAKSGIPFLIQGTTSNPVFLPDAGALVRAGISNLLKSQGGDQPNNLGGILGGILGRKKK
jgi:AsmA protein